MSDLRPSISVSDRVRGPEWLEEGEPLSVCVGGSWGQVPGAVVCICSLSRRCSDDIMAHGDRKNSSAPFYRQRGEEVKDDKGMIGNTVSGRERLIQYK